MIDASLASYACCSTFDLALALILFKSKSRPILVAFSAPKLKVKFLSLNSISSRPLLFVPAAVVTTVKERYSLMAMKKAT